MKRPNILITGTPGTGKSRLAKELAKLISFDHIDISSLAKANLFLDGYDEEYNCSIVDEDKLNDYLEPIMEEGGKIVDYLSCELFPERFFDAVYVLQCNNTILHDRLTARGYSEKKIRMNIECEIFQTILEEAVESFSLPTLVVAIKGETEDDLDKNLIDISSWVAKQLNKCN